uniref:CUB domain-containing protein 1 n=1 Tax=Centroberyx gerrardi TaxID=166262 RepID=UPI003AAE4447
MQLCATCAVALLGVLFLSGFNLSECLKMAVRPDKGSVVTVSTDLPSDQCVVCTVSGVNDTQTSCHSSLPLVPEEEVTLLFNCSQPIEQAYTVKITRSIECTKDTCSPTTGEAQPSLLTEFTRTFTWDLKAPEKTVVDLHILGEGLLETSQPKSCPDRFQYSVVRPKLNGNVQTQAYCRGGSVTNLDLPNQAAMSLQVGPKAKVDSVLFQASAKPLKGRTMVITDDPGTTVVFNRDPDKLECNVCSGDPSTCNPTELTLPDPQKTSLEFSCPQPQEVFSVQIKKKIECTKTSCNPATGAVQPDLKEFKRSLTWDISVPGKTMLTLGFPGDGLREMTGADKCQDGYQYSLSTTNSEAEVKTRTYCKSGPVSQLDLLGKTTVTVEVPKGGELNSTAFTAKAAARRGRMMSVIPDPDTRVIISRQTGEPDCSVCAGEEPNQKCDQKYLRLTDARNTSVEFGCPQPQDFFSVEINREIDCTETTCAGDIVQAESSLFPDFNRTFTWDLKVPSTHAFQLGFPEPGMRQIPNGNTCPDEHTCTIVTYLRSGPATIGTYCKGGTVTTIQVLYKGRMLLKVPGDRKLEPLDFKLSVGSKTTMLAIVKVNLPRGVSDTEFITANYPGDFPDNQHMMWDFIVPGMHNYTMRFQDHTAPECLKKEVMVEYQKEDKKVTKLTLTDPQPAHKQGNFKMLLWNCETNTTLQGLALKFTVSVMRSGHPVLCTVDLTKKQGVSLQIEKVGSDPYCEMSIGSEVKKKINVATGTKASLSFLDCPNEDVRLTASKIIGCQHLNSCSVSGMLLTVPKLDSCLPMPLHSFTWHLNIPEDGTVELVSPTGTLRQSLPGQECNDSVPLHVAEGDGSSIGDFCSKGIIQKVQVHSNVSVTATAQDFTKTRGPFLNVSFNKEISESIIYTVSPKMSSPALLATPNWPGGMKPSSTVSWIVKLPSRYKAAMQFVNVSQPKCGQRHTSIKVQRLGSEEEMLSRREDEVVEDKLEVPGSFYLNMSNCMPEDGHFGAVTKVILQKKTNLLAILLGIAGALLLVVTVLAVVCVITKKKKKGQMNTSSIYVGKGNIFLPGDRHFAKARSDNDSHVYASIDETMVYGHLLRDSTYADSMQDHFKGLQVDSYRTFTGPIDGEPPVIIEPDSKADPDVDQYKPFLDPSESFIPPRPRTPIDRQDSLGFQDRRMVDNELYTFKSTGEMNTIRLSGADLEPQPTVDTIREESL